MKNEPLIPIKPFSPETHLELEDNRKRDKERLVALLREAENCKQRIAHIDGLLGSSNNVPNDDKEKSGHTQNSAALKPTEFVIQALNENPDRWIPINEFLTRARIAYDAGDLINRKGDIENSIHSVLTRFRQKHQVWTRGRRETRKYKLKP